MIEILLIQYNKLKIKALLVRSRERNCSFSRKLYIQKKPGKKLIFHAIELMNQYKYTKLFYQDDCRIESLGGKVLWRAEYEE